MQNYLTITSSRPSSQLSKSDSTDDQGSLDQIKNKQSAIKYKTQICKNYSEKGYCPYSSKCQFAHGYNQLNKQVLENKKAYRTRKCKSFWDVGICRYGFRCQFSHYQVIREPDASFLKIASFFINPPALEQKSRLEGVFCLERLKN